MVDFSSSFTQWPRVGQRWPALNIDSPQYQGLEHIWLAKQLGHYPNMAYDLISGADGTGTGLKWASPEGWPSAWLDNDVVNAYVTLPTPVFAPFSGTSNPFTLSLWIFMTSYPGTLTLVIFKTSGANPFLILLSDAAAWMPFAIGCAGDNPYTHMRYDSGETSSSAFLNRWRHILVTYNGGGAASTSNYQLYLDGLGASPGVGSGFGGDAQVNRLGIDSGATGHFRGYMLDVRLYNTWTSAALARQHFDPLTRWDLYKQHRRVWAFVPPAAGRTTKNTDSNPLGVHTAMGWRVNTP